MEGEIDGGGREEGTGVGWGGGDRKGTGAIRGGMRRRGSSREVKDEVKEGRVGWGQGEGIEVKGIRRYWEVRLEGRVREGYGRAGRCGDRRWRLGGLGGEKGRMVGWKDSNFGKKKRSSLPKKGDEKGSTKGKGERRLLSFTTKKLGQEKVLHSRKKEGEGHGGCRRIGNRAFCMAKKKPPRSNEKGSFSYYPGKKRGKKCTEKNGKSDIHEWVTDRDALKRQSKGRQGLNHCGNHKGKTSDRGDGGGKRTVGRPAVASAGKKKKICPKKRTGKQSKDTQHVGEQGNRRCCLNRGACLRKKGQKFCDWRGRGRTG